MIRISAIFPLDTKSVRYFNGEVSVYECEAGLKLPEE